MEIGEPVVDIKAIGGAEGAWFILIHGERSIICINDSGCLVFYKKLECPVTHLLPYKVCDDEGMVMSYCIILQFCCRCSL